MRKVFLFVHNEGASKREEFVKIFDSIPEVLTWRYDMVSCFYLVSDHSAKTLATKIRDKTPGKGKILVTEIGDGYWGWLTNETWYLFKNKWHKPD